MNRLHDHFGGVGEVGECNWGGTGLLPGVLLGFGPGVFGVCEVAEGDEIFLGWEGEEDAGAPVGIWLVQSTIDWNAVGWDKMG